MAELVADCPRCGAVHVTFDALATQLVGKKHSWQHWYEVFCVCRHCHKSTVFVLSERGTESSKVVSKLGFDKLPGALNDVLNVERFINIADTHVPGVPEFVPDSIGTVYKEGARCLAVGCYNAAATMFRLCVDLSTRALLPEEDADGLNRKIRRDLGLRLPWLFDHGAIPESLRDLSTCIKEDGNDGAHVGSLTRVDADDLLDFTNALLERLYTEPARLQIAKERRDARRADKQLQAEG